MTRKLLISLAMTSSLLLGGCVGDITNALTGNNGGSLSFNPSDVLLRPEESSQVVQLVNSSPIDASVHDITFTPFPAGSQFFIVDNNCPTVLAQNQACSFTVGFNRTVESEVIQTQTLTVNYMAGSTSSTSSLYISYLPPQPPPPPPPPYNQGI